MRSKKSALFIAFLSLSVAGSFIKIPAIVGSVAFDSMPALAASVLLTPAYGMGIAALGHLMSAYLGGFPLGPLHLIIAVQMGILALGFGLMYRRKARTSAVLFFIIGNGIAAPLCFWPFLGKSMVLAIMPSLFAAAVLNGITAQLIIPRLQRVFQGSVVRVKE